MVDARFVNLWRQLAVRYRNKSPKLLFELFNEPNGRLQGEPWNLLAAEALKAVRESNPTRTIVVGPSGGNHPRGLASFRTTAT